jgi:FixJ family two-component response regulator
MNEASKPALAGPENALVLLDVVLPKLSGLEVYDYISREGPDIPVLFVTGYSAGWRGP